MGTEPFLAIRNGEAIPLAAVPVAKPEDWRALLVGQIAQGARISALIAIATEEKRARLLCVLADDAAGRLLLAASDIGGSYPSLTTDIPQAHLFEREIFELHGIRPEGHPSLKPVRELAPPTGFSRVEGEQIHEVAVGPIHAGVIEPGHFRFQCHGETVFHLEIALGYQHRGIERALSGGPGIRAPHLIETAAGDSSVGHALAYSLAIEALSGTHAPQRAQAIRAIALELERLANHTGDLGALAGDVGYLPTASFCGRLRGDFLNLTARICGGRLGRGLVRPGGTRFDLAEDDAASLANALERAVADVGEATKLLWERPSVLSRFETVGTLSRQACLDLGLVGPAARASGVRRDVRSDFPLGAYLSDRIPVATGETGDVHARAWVRWQEIRKSALFIRRQASCLPAGSVSKNLVRSLAASHVAVSLVEGWRGEICHVAITDPQGRFSTYKIIDPSFHNWKGLEMAMRTQQISDFPLCNKSFNLSYCGHDL